MGRRQASGGRSQFQFSVVSLSPVSWQLKTDPANCELTPAAWIGYTTRKLYGQRFLAAAQAQAREGARCDSSSTRSSFCILISDGTYPPERQQRLFQACQKAGLEWGEARAYILSDALLFLQGVVQTIIADANITADEIQHIRKLQKRLAIPD